MAKKTDSPMKKARDKIFNLVEGTEKNIKDYKKLLMRKNSQGSRIFRSLEKSGHTKYGAKLIMTHNGAGSVVTKVDTRHRDSHADGMKKVPFSWGKRGARLAGLEPAT